MARKAVTVADVLPEFERAKHLLGEGTTLMESSDPSKIILIAGGRGKEYSCQALKSNLAFLVDVANGRTFQDANEEDESEDLGSLLTG